MRTFWVFIFCALAHIKACKFVIFSQRFPNRSIVVYNHRYWARTSGIHMWTTRRIHLWFDLYRKLWLQAGLLSKRLSIRLFL